MPHLVLLDTGVLGMLTYPQKNPQVRPWLFRLRDAGIRIRVPEIADYELRRELLRKRNRRGISRLDGLKAAFGYDPITTARRSRNQKEASGKAKSCRPAQKRSVSSTEAMLQAAEFWADARLTGRPTADPNELDGDVILAAQARRLTLGGDEVVVATTNVVHLARFVSARKWDEIG